MTSPRPLSIQALAARSQPTGYDPSKSLEDLLRIAITEHDAGEQAEAANDTDSAFIHFAKASTLMLTELPNHPKFGELTQSQNEAIVTHGQMMNDSLSAIELLVKKRSLDWRTRHPDTYLSAPAPTLTPHRPISGLTIQQQQRPRPPPQDTHGAGQQARQARQYQEAQRLIDTEQEYGERGQDYKQPQLHQRPPSLLPSQAKRPAVYLQRSLSDSNILLPAPLNTSSNFPPQILASEPLQELQSLRIQPQVEYQHGARADYYPIQPSLKERQHYVVATSRTDLFGPQTKSTRPTSELDTSKQLQPNTFPPVRDQPPHEEFGSGLHPLKDPSITTSKVSGAMPISDVIALLTAHRCPDITSRLDLKKCGATAFFGGGFGDVYQGALDGGEHVAIKCARFYLRQDDEKGHKVLKVQLFELAVWPSICVDSPSPRSPTACCP
ncbi:hypothetical protein FRC12_000917 [Ceratobasidium sp. 428]|nr:hypothetical protein FRC12_000917 [Ceratobasidium sp. 428]